MAEFPKLVVLSENFRGMSFSLKQPKMTAGRKSDNDICIKDASMSSHHCEFICQDGKYFICDSDSTNGTRVNNVPAQAGVMTPLKNSDLLQLGSVEVLFDYDDGSGPSASRTQTGIDLTSADSGLNTVKNLTNLSPFATNETKKEAVNRKLVIAGIVVAAIVILVLLLKLGSTMLSM